MDFSLTWQQQTVVEELEKFLKKEVAPYVEEYDKKKDSARPVQAEGNIQTASALWRNFRPYSGRVRWYGTRLHYNGSHLSEDG